MMNNIRSCVLWNCRSTAYYKKIPLEEYIKKNNPFMVILTETHHPANRRWSSIPNYSVYETPSMVINNNDGNIREAGGIAIIIRNDCTAVRQIDGSILSGFNDRGAPYSEPKVSSQWCGWSINVEGWQRPLWVVPIYLQSRAGKFSHEFDPLCEQLDAITDHIDGLNPQERPWLLWCGDFNNRVRELGPLPSGASYDAINVVEEFLHRDFTCHNINYCHGKPTHRLGGVLDLIFEYSPDNNEPFLVESMKVHHKGLSEPLSSDHYPIEFVLRSSPPSPHQAAGRMVWKIDKATPEQQIRFADQIQEALDKASTPSGVAVVEAINELGSFKCTNNYESDQQKALRLVDNALQALNALVNELGDEIIGRRVASPHERPDWTPSLRMLYKRMANTRKASLHNPGNARLAAEADAAAKEFNNEFIENKKRKMNEIKASIEEEINADTEHPKHTVAWSAVRKYGTITQPKSSTIKAGLKRTDGTYTTSILGSQKLLEEYFKKVFSPHPVPEGPAPESKAAEIDRIRDEEIKEMENDIKKHRPPEGRTFSRGLPHRFILAKGGEVYKLLSRTSRKTASGPDNIAGSLVVWAAESPEFCKAIKNIFNFCYAFGILPQLWRRADLVPIPKKTGPLDDCNSFRPISITCILMRRMETLVKKKLQPIVEQKLSRWQAGFRRSRSTRQQILLLQHTIIKALRYSEKGRRGNVIIKEGQPMPVVFLDIAKAFDSVPHDYVRLKLWKMLKSSHNDFVDNMPILSFVTAFLQHRQFRILAPGVAPGEWIDITAGVPQGAVLSPILYAIFIDDLLPNCLINNGLNSATTALAFADDLSILPPVNLDAAKRKEAIQELLNDVGDWARRWGVRFSATKSACVWYHNNKEEEVRQLSQDQLFIPYTDAANDRVVLPFQNEYQYLGLWLDAALSGERHHRHMIEKCSTVSRMIRTMIRPEGIPGLPVLHTLVKALLLPRITYGLPFIDLQQKQYDALNRLVQRPILSAAALPWSVHRASAAAYFELPTVEVMKDYSITELIASTLRLTNDKGIRFCPDHHPAFHLVRTTCNKQSVERALDNAAPPSAPFSPIDHFPYAVDRLHGTELLPDGLSQLRLRMPNPLHTPQLKWKVNQFKQQCRRSARKLQVYRAVMESRGCSIKVGGLRSHNKASTIVDPNNKRGAFFPPVLGIPDQVTEEKELLSIIDSLPHLNEPKSRLPFEVQYASPLHLRLRSRCLLNRASGLAAVKHYHNHKNPDPTLRQCQYCKDNNNLLIAQTLHHAFNECPQYQMERQATFDKLKDLIKKVKERAAHHNQMKSILDNDNIIFSHCILFSPFILQCIRMCKLKIYELLNVSGKFLEYINSINPL